MQQSIPGSTIKSVAFFEKYKRTFYKFVKRNGMLYRFIAQKQGLQQKIGFIAVVLCLVMGGILLMSNTYALHPSIQSNAKDSLVVNNMSFMTIKDMSSSSKEQGIALQWPNQGKLITFEIDGTEAANPANVFYILPSQDLSSFYIVDHHFKVISVIKENDFMHAISVDHDMREELLQKALHLLSN